jgi:hypothetical protein
LRTFGTESSGLEQDGDLNLQLQTVMMSRPIFRGISPSLPELDTVLSNRIIQDVALYKQTVYPILANSMVYHHTPVLPMMEPSPWVVLEYAAPDKSKEVVGLFRTSQTGNPVYRYEPRGIDFSKNYSVHFQSSGESADLSGAQLLQSGIPVRLDDNLTSELLVIEQK